MPRCLSSRFRRYSFTKFGLVPTTEQIFIYGSSLVGPVLTFGQCDMREACDFASRSDAREEPSYFVDDDADLFIGQLSEQRQRQNLLGCLQRFWEIVLGVIQVSVGVQVRQRDRVVHASFDAVGLQEILQTVAVAVRHSNDVQM